MTTLDPYEPPKASIDAPGAATPEHAKCPKCGAQSAKKVGFNWWGGALGPRLFHVVKCQGCGRQYNGKTGASLTKVIVVYQVVAIALMGALAYAFTR